MNMQRILIIDDDPVFVDLLRKSLDPHLYHVATATNGVKGLASIHENRPDLILLDIKMPDVGGIEFLRQLREKDDKFNVPIVVVSNDSSLDTISESATYGIRSYIVKANESTQAIADTIERLFQRMSQNPK